MVPYISSYDYSNYLVKLDSVLVDVLKNTALDNKRMVENFKELMLPVEQKELKVSELFELWKDYVAKRVETSGLDVDYDDDVSYEMVEVSFEVEYTTERDWSSFKYAVIAFECEHDESMNVEITISKYGKKDQWDINHRTSHEISSLRFLNDFEILLMRLSQASTKILIDDENGNDEVRPDKEPEATYN